MNKIDTVNAFGTMYNVAADSENVAYSGNDVTNIKEAIDDLYERTEDSGGSSGGGGDTVVSAAPYFLNGKLPVWKDNLKILFIANSFVNRSFNWELVNVLNGINAANPNSPITGENLKIEQFYRGGASMTTFLERLKNFPHVQDYYNKIEYNNGTWSLVGTAKGIQDAIESDAWDVIILQAWPSLNTNGESASDYDTFKDTLKEFIFQIRKLCPNPAVCIGLNMIWPCGNTVFTMPNFMNNYNGICNATKQMISDSGVDVIIPSGTAMANAVNTNTFNGANTHFMMRDSVHAGKGVAEYIIACTIYEAVLAPVLKKSMLNITAVPPVNENDAGSNAYPQANIPVSAENLGLCHEIALHAVCDMYNVDTTIDPIIS